MKSLDITNDAPDEYEFRKVQAIMVAFAILLKLYDRKNSIAEMWHI
jgi:hypothetical protein